MKPWVFSLGLIALACSQGLQAAGPNSRSLGEPRTASPSVLPQLERFDIALVDAPAAQVFLQIAQGSPYQVLVGPEVNGKISLNLRQTTVIEALDAIKELYGYDYKLAGDKVYVYSNAVQTRIFRINYLPGRRQGESDTRVSTSALAVGSSNQGSGSGGAANNGSSGGSSGSGSTQLRSFESAQVRTTSDANFWSEVRESLTLLVGQGGGRSLVLNPSAGVIVVRAPGPELVQVEQYLAGHPGQHRAPGDAGGQDP